MTTAKTVLTAIADSVAVLLAPAARGAHTASTLRQIGDIAGDLPLEVADLHAGMAWVGQACDSDDAPTAARRTTCREIAALCATAVDARRGDRTRWADVLDAVVAALSDSADPRHRAIAATARRESEEIRRFVTVI